MKVKIEGKIYNTNELTQVLESQGEVFPGVLLKGAWKNSDGKIIIIYYSIWDRGDGCHKGYIGCIADEFLIRQLSYLYHMSLED
jgi:hypothetical protein